jgi:hypothetical protein
MGSVDPVLAPWRSWLQALATDAEAAIAAAQTYASLLPEGRDAWLDALASEAPTLPVPPVAVYGPLLGVEAEPARIARIVAALGPDAASLARPGRRASAAWGAASDGTRACVVVSPIYLDYVEVLTCRYSARAGFVWARRDPLLHVANVPIVGEVDGIPVEPTPLGLVIDELAYAVLADRRRSRAPPAALESFVHLFTP